MKIKKLISIIAIFSIVLSSFTFSFAKRKSTDLDENRYISLGLYFGSNYASYITMESEDGFLVYDKESGELIDTIDDTEISFTKDDYECSGNIYMSAAEDEDERFITVTTDKPLVIKNCNVYRDGIYLVNNSGLRVINYITLEHYVWGVVNKEMSSKNPYEALKAQAVASRTYALTKHHESYDINVCATTDCQAYGGVNSESDITTQACIDTEGEVLVYDGEPIIAYFSSSNGGGYTLSLSDAWGSKDVPYLQSKIDEFTPSETPASPWKFTDTFDEIRTKLIKAGYPDVGKVKSFEILEETDFGAVTMIAIKGTDANVLVPRNRIMSTFNLRSTYFTVGDYEFNVIEHSDATPEYYYVLSESGVDRVNTDSIYVYNGFTTEKLKISSTASGYTKKSDICKNGTVYWYGLGFGHGIGMSQYGAFAMAEAGYDYDDILKYYYIDVDLINWYD